MRAIKPKTQLGLTIYRAMQEQSVSPNDLAARVDVTYEAIRRIVGGHQPPSKRLLKDICAVLNLNAESTDDMRKIEQIRRKHGTLPRQLTSKHPELQPIEELWDFLTPEAKAQIVELVRYHAEQATKASHRSSPPRIRPQSTRSH